MNKQVAEVPLRYVTAVELSDGPAKQGEGYGDTACRTSAGESCACR